MVFETRTEAHRYADAGLYVIPIRRKSKKPAIKTGPQHATAATVDHAKIHAWFSQRPDWNVAIVCTPSRIVVIDVDGPEGEAALADLVAEHGPLPETWEAWTSRGRHLLFRWPDGVTVPTGTAGPKLDIRGAGSYIVAPPSTHPSGDVYRWGTTGVDIPEAPGWLVTDRTVPKTGTARKRRRTVATPCDEAVAVVDELLVSVCLRLEDAGYFRAAAALETRHDSCFDV